MDFSPKIPTKGEISDPIAKYITPKMPEAAPAPPPEFSTLDQSSRGSLARPSHTTVRAVPHTAVPISNKR